jgi:hypothetical protein
MLLSLIHLKISKSLDATQAGAFMASAFSVAPLWPAPFRPAFDNTKLQLTISIIVNFKSIISLTLRFLLLYIQLYLSSN